MTPSEYKARIFAEIDERIAANTGLTAAQMQKLKEQIERIPVPEMPKPRASSRTVYHADTPTEG